MAQRKRKTPPTRQCAAMQNFYHQCDEHPAYRERHARIEEVTRRRMSARMAPRRSVRVIPVVVHVLHRTASESISAAQIRSQIRVLNRDFRAKNTDRSRVPAVWKPLAADTMVQFELATRDPKGRKTNGITRTPTARTFFPADDSMKFRGSGGASAWTTSRYLNIWVCTLRGGLLGYAQFPGMRRSTDGVVIRNTAFGTVGSAANFEQLAPGQKVFLTFEPDHGLCLTE